MPFPIDRPRRIRNNPILRRMVEENKLSIQDLIQPKFVVPGRNVKVEITSMPGQFHFSVDRIVDEAKSLSALGVPAILLFGIPDSKDDLGTSAYVVDGIIQTAVKNIKSEVSDLLIITDVCLCEYTDHGHCGVVEHGSLDNDRSVELIAKTALSHAEAGADMVAPSDMMDGRVLAIRSVLDDNGFSEVPIMSYAVKYASAFYGPFRDAAGSAPQFGDRRGYQMDPANVREALYEAALDDEEGADILMVKPGLPYLDVLSKVSENTDKPTAVYSVSGEYAMIEASSLSGQMDRKKVILESMTAFKRAGADIIITYHAAEIAGWLRDIN